jgi:hypothetical protein
MIDATVTARFFRIVKPEAAAPNPETILRNLDEKDLTDRAFDLDEGVVLRLERLEIEPNYLSGEFCRIQSTNIPPTAGDDGLSPTILEDGKGLGHLAAFRFHVPTQIMLLQMNQQCATANRISIYLGMAERKPMYVLEPVLRADTFKRMQRAEVKAFTIKVAEPQHLDVLDDPSASALKGVRTAAKAFNAREIEFTVFAGPKKKGERSRPHLLQLAARKALAKLAKNGGDNVKTLKAQIAENDETRWVDLLEDQLKHTEILALNSDNPDANYETRKRFLTRIFGANIEALREFYGPQNGDN